MTCLIGQFRAVTDIYTSFRLSLAVDLGGLHHGIYIIKLRNPMFDPRHGHNLAPNIRFSFDYCPFNQTTYSGIGSWPSFSTSRTQLLVVGPSADQFKYGLGPSADLSFSYGSLPFSRRYIQLWHSPLPQETHSVICSSWNWFVSRYSLHWLI